MIFQRCFVLFIVTSILLVICNSTRSKQIQSREPDWLIQVKHEINQLIVRRLQSANCNLRPSNHHKHNPDMCHSLRSLIFHSMDHIDERHPVYSFLTHLLTSSNSNNTQDFQYLNILTKLNKDYQLYVFMHWLEIKCNSNKCYSYFRHQQFKFCGLISILDNNDAIQLVAKFLSLSKENDFIKLYVDEIWNKFILISINNKLLEHGQNVTDFNPIFDAYLSTTINNTDCGKFLCAYEMLIAFNSLHKKYAVFMPKSWMIYHILTAKKISVDDKIIYFNQWFKIGDIIAGNKVANFMVFNEFITKYLLKYVGKNNLEKFLNDYLEIAIIRSYHQAAEIYKNYVNAETFVLLARNSLKWNALKCIKKIWELCERNELNYLINEHMIDLTQQIIKYNTNQELNDPVTLMRMQTIGNLKEVIDQYVRNRYKFSTQTHKNVLRNAKLLALLSKLPNSMSEMNLAKSGQKIHEKNIENRKFTLSV